MPTFSHHNRRFIKVTCLFKHTEPFFFFLIKHSANLKASSHLSEATLHFLFVLMCAQ